MVVLIFILGLIFGSFANVILLRYNTGESIVYSGSRCFGCGRNLNWVELIPVFSFIALRGRCFSCKSKISWQYPFVELGTGVLFFLLFLKLKEFGFWDFDVRNVLEMSNVKLEILYNILFSFLYIVTVYIAWFSLFVASIYDLRHMILPDRFIAIAAAAGVLYAFLLNGFSPAFLYHILSGVAVSAIFFLLWRLSGGRWMGAGDAKYVFPFALLMPPSSFLGGIIAAFIIGAIVGIALIFLGKKRLQSHIPFGPFLFLGGFIAHLAGGQIFTYGFPFFL